mmetsp:Transcript_96517/g.278580  ORF Transcript_96517/g.278580 Transcript_96517/m.278580 type:complete len:200 (+) Transcript_96517:907-1506(+)
MVDDARHGTPSALDVRPVPPRVAAAHDELGEGLHRLVFADVGRPTAAVLDVPSGGLQRRPHRLVALLVVLHVAATIDLHVVDAPLREPRGVLPLPAKRCRVAGARERGLGGVEAEGRAPGVHVVAEGLHAAGEPVGVRLPRLSAGVVLLHPAVVDVDAPVAGEQVASLQQLVRLVPVEPLGDAATGVFVAIDVAPEDLP